AAAPAATASRRCASASARGRPPCSSALRSPSGPRTKVHWRAGPARDDPASVSAVLSCRRSSPFGEPITGNRAYRDEVNPPGSTSVARAVAQFAVSGLAAMLLLAVAAVYLFSHIARAEAIDDAPTLTELVARSVVEPA